MGKDSKHIGSIVQWEIAKPKTEDDQMMGKPTKTKENSHNYDHPGDFALGLFGIRHVFNGVHRCPQITDGPQVGDAQDQHWNDIAEDKSAEVHYFALGTFPDGMADSNISHLELLVVTEIRSREDE